MDYQDHYARIREIVIETLRSEDERGGPMQREYPRAVIESMASSIALRVVELPTEV